MEANQCDECDSTAWKGQVNSMAVTRPPVFSILSLPGWVPNPNPEFPIIPKDIRPCDPSFPGGCCCSCYYYDTNTHGVFAYPRFLSTGFVTCSSSDQCSVLTRCVSPLNPCPSEHHLQRSIENNMLLSPGAEIKSKSNEGLDSVNVSESGWTTYLDQSLCNSNGFTSNGSVDTCEKEEQKSVMADEDQDSSMASDASSGPEQPLEFQQCFGGVSPTDETGNGGAIIGMPQYSAKRRRVDADSEQSLCLLEDTASSPICSSKSGLTENKLRVKEILELSEGISDSREADAVNMRLDLLHSILPENTATPICREDMLGVTMEYINSLEKRIKIYKEEHNEERSPNKALLMFLTGRDQGVEEHESCGALRRRGLCLVPLSTLWSSI